MSRDPAAVFQPGDGMRLCLKNKKQEFILSLLWRIEVQNQAAGRTMDPLKVLEEDPSSPLPVLDNPGVSWLTVT